MRRTVAKPRPVPPGLAVTNGSNTRAANPGSIPTPVSITSSRTNRPSARAWSTSVPPPGIASSALSIRFNSTCSNSSASSITGGRSGAGYAAMRTPFVSAVGLRKSTIRATTSASWVGAGFTCESRANFRKSLETSRMRRHSPLSRATRALACRSRGVSGASRSSSKSCRCNKSVLRWFLTSWTKPPASWANSESGRAAFTEHRPRRGRDLTPRPPLRFGEGRPRFAALNSGGRPQVNTPSRVLPLSVSERGPGGEVSSTPGVRSPPPGSTPELHAVYTQSSHSPATTLVSPAPHRVPRRVAPLLGHLHQPRLGRAGHG